MIKFERNHLNAWHKTNTMENSQLTDVLRSFSKAELKEFGKYLKSPYFNNRSEVVRFYEAVKDYYPEYKSNNLDERIIFSKVYPKKKFSDVMMRKLVSLTTGYAMDFLVIENFRKGELEYNVKLLDILRQKKLPALFEKKIKVIDNLLLNSKQSLEYHESKYKYTSTVNGYLLVKNEKSMVNRFQNELDDFIGHFFYVVLVQYIRLSEWSRYYNIKFDMKLYDEVIEFLSKNDYQDTPLVSLYYKMLMLLNTGEEKYYFELLEARNKYEGKLDKINDYNAAIVLMQYCHKRVQKGDAEFRRHQFDITKMLLKNDLIPEGYLEPYFFTNIVRNASNIKEFKWLEEFIKEYKNKLNPEFTDETVKYSLAMVEFSKGSYEKALSLFSAIKIERSNMKIDIKNMLIMIYYELGYTEELFSLIDSYKHFLGRDKDITKNSKEKNTIFLKYVSDIVKINLSKNKEDALFLKKEIESAPYINMKDWLMGKINLLCSN